MAKKEAIEREVKMGPDDPASDALNKIAEILGPYDREAQLRILSSACVSLGELDYAEQFINILRRDRFKKKLQETRDA